MVMKWDKFRGEIKRPGCSATIEMMDLPEPFWMAHFNFMTPEDCSQVSKGFEEGKLEQAYKWCVDQISKHEEGITGASSESAHA